MKESISKNLSYLNKRSPQEIFDERKKKFLKIGIDKGFIDNLEDLSSTEIKTNSIDQFFKNKKNIYYLAGSLFILAILIFSIL